ncbi:MAG: tRNA adenosine(34) deaminase TadA [Balneolaceae bacterium]|nr:tRNA adenosine(34) deaminase TadA [Balneolaceae bacterium]
MIFNGKNGSDIPQIRQHQKYMMQAFKLAEQAYDEDEIPVGAIIVKDNRIVGKGYNQTERLKDATAHAEMLAISAACSTLQNKYLPDCTLYVTLEPCPMCTGALVWSKIKRVVFGAPDAKAGACGSLFNLSNSDRLNHQAEIIQGIMEEDCKWILKQFFEEKRSGENGQS